MVKKDWHVEGLGGLVQVEEIMKRTKSNARSKSIKKKSSQTAASKQMPTQERR